MTKCLGCGSILQNKDKNKEGYVKDLSKKYCERCFRIKNYNEYSFIDKDNAYYLNNLKEIENSNDLVLIVTDFLNINLFDKIKIKNPHINVITKYDIIPRSFNLDKFVKDYIVVGAKNNYHLDDLMELINEKKTSNRVYVIGYTNTGKSTLINKIAYNYKVESNITTSNLPSTTLDLISVKINDLIFIDTPGLLNESIIRDKNLLKKINPKKEIKPMTYQIKRVQTIIIENILKLEIYSKTNITFYFSNSLSIERSFKKIDKLDNFKKNDLFIKGYIFINGLGFIYLSNKAKISLYLSEGIKYSVREDLI